MGAGSKANHLAYLGDATIGAEVNVGAGTITCNYDGAAKHQTVIERRRVHRQQLDAGGPGHGRPGSVRGRRLGDHRPMCPPGALGIGRGRQENKEGWVENASRQTRQFAVVSCQFKGQKTCELADRGIARL